MLNGGKPVVVDKVAFEVLDCVEVVPVPRQSDADLLIRRVEDVTALVRVVHPTLHGVPNFLFNAGDRRISIGLLDAVVVTGRVFHVGLVASVQTVPHVRFQAIDAPMG